jgi:2-phospho-L-lactate guanylyltransferase
LKRLAVLVPFKAARAKSRLSAVLSPRQRRDFSELMLSGVLRTLERTGLSESSYVVSSDERGLSIAEERGANSLAEPVDRGVNAAVQWAMSMLPWAEGFMVVPSDLPLLTPTEVRNAVALNVAPGRIVISPSRAFDGTNLLLFTKPTPIRLRYDDDSFWNHIAEASRAGLRLCVYTARGFVFDVDSPDDLRDLARLRINSPQAKFAWMVLRKRDS